MPKDLLSAEVVKHLNNIDSSSVDPNLEQELGDGILGVFNKVKENLRSYSNIRIKIDGGYATIKTGKPEEASYQFTLNTLSRKVEINISETRAMIRCVRSSQRYGDDLNITSGEINDVATHKFIDILEKNKK